MVLLAEHDSTDALSSSIIPMPNRHIISQRMYREENIGANADASSERETSSPPASSSESISHKGERREIVHLTSHLVAHTSFALPVSMFLPNFCALYHIQLICIVCSDLNGWVEKSFRVAFSCSFECRSVFVTQRSRDQEQCIVA